MKKWIWIVIGILVIGFVGYQWYNSRTSSQEVTTQVRTAVVQKGNLEVKISGSGSIQPVTSEDLKSTIDNNEIDEVLVVAGETVNAGDELITFTDDSDPITAPVDGLVTTIAVAAGDRVTNGQVVTHLTNYKDLQTVVQVDESDIPKIKEGQTVELSVSAYPDQAYTGKVTAIADEGTSANGSSTFDVTIHIENPVNLKVGMSAEANILTASKKDALYVPVDALYTNNNEKYVVVASAGARTNQASGAATQLTVKTGLATEEYVEITDGVSEGDVVQLPQLTSGSSSTNQRGGMMQGMGGTQGGNMPPNGGGKGGESTGPSN
ncbi:multidrug efflux pump subunit AcrA (membrane-fusion protein) [Bacillus sp. SLBN-46]|uniref:efflux RND transporter periplasmic adaptor subunit n=1 Tax=Bacillus sp. SLBN-46 TaxID=3042283 RepID=UPI002857AA13|nr:efflux RND transporter periplasmic adaptor subunit [Bacillus sp. SLBN-46]MDR6121513.1 multidrug efflux pump subunit AcrA (membrane-fusion protein) [Bacillus sp. SLBN-46]